MNESDKSHWRQTPVVTSGNVETIQSLGISMVRFAEHISTWIDDINSEEYANGRPETMLPRSPAEIHALLTEGKAVVAISWGTDKNAPIVAGFCALTYELFQGQTGMIYELGSLIKTPSTSIKGIGITTLVATLQLNRSQEAEAIVAYANRNSLPLFTNGCEKYLGVGATIVSDEVHASRFPYLPEYSGDTIIDLTPLRDVVLSR